MTKILIILTLTVFITNCKTAKDNNMSKNTNVTNSNSHNEDMQPTDIKHENSFEEVNIVNASSNQDEGNKINAKLDCGNKTAVELLTISAKKYDVSNFKCKIRRNNGLKIEFSDNSGLTFSFHLIGGDYMMIQKDLYPCKNENSTKYAVITLQSEALGTHNFGDLYKGHVRITDYGMSSDVLCGTFKVIDTKGNIIEGTFYEMISSF